MGFDSLYRDCQFIIVAKGLLRFTTPSFWGLSVRLFFKKIPYEILVFLSEIHLQHQLTSDHIMPKPKLFRVNLAILPINTKDLMIQVLRSFLIYAVVVDLHFIIVQDHLFLWEQSPFLWFHP